MQVSKSLMKDYGLFTIGKIDDIEIGSKGLHVFLSFRYKRKIETRDYLTDYEDRNKLFLGKRIFVKFIPERKNKSIQVSLDCIVSDSIKSAPALGWTEDWMKEHFPYCIEAMNE